MNITIDQILRTNEKYLKGVLKDYTPKSIFDRSGFVTGFLHYESLDYTVLKDCYGNRYEVEKNSVTPIYENVYKYKESKNSFVILEELLKYGSTNDTFLHEFNSLKEMNDFYNDRLEYSEKIGCNGKWSALLRSKLFDEIRINVDL